MAEQKSYLSLSDLMSNWFTPYRNHPKGDDWYWGIIDFVDHPKNQRFLGDPGKKLNY